MSTEQGKLQNIITNELSRGIPADQIEGSLVQQGHDPRFAKEMVAEVSKLFYARRRTQGVAYILAAAAVCFISCVMALLQDAPITSLPITLYGLTSVGIALAFIGFMKIF